MSFRVPWTKKGVFVHAWFQVSFSADSWDLNLDVWGSKTIHLAEDVLQKPIFAEIGMLMIAGCIFHELGGLGTSFHDFCCPRGWLENCRILKVILGSPQILATFVMEGTRFIPGFHYNNFRISKTD